MLELAEWRKENSKSSQKRGRGNTSTQRNNKSRIQCYNYKKKNGHYKLECRTRR